MDGSPSCSGAPSPPSETTLRDLRARQVIGDDAFHVVEEDIDLLDLTADTRVRPSPDETAS